MEKYSGGPNFNAIPAKGGPTRVRAMTANVPAMKELKAAIPRADLLFLSKPFGAHPSR